MLFPKEGSATKGAKDAPLRKSDKRKLRDAVREQFGVALHGNDDEEKEAATATARMSELIMGGTLVRRTVVVSTPGQTTTRVTLYLKPPVRSSNAANKNATDAETCSSNENDWPYSKTTHAIFMQVEKDDTLIPTVSLLSVWPTLIPSVTVPWNVSKFTCRGAHLMRSGMLQWPSSMNHNNNGNHLVSIGVRGNPQPFAVGQLSCSSTEFGPGTKGIGVTILTCYGDDLYRMSHSFPTNLHNAVGEGGMVNALGGGGIFDSDDYGNIGFRDGAI
eukprot:scaffold203356_cov47-Attheya_sp.AAC.1